MVAAASILVARIGASRRVDAMVARADLQKPDPVYPLLDMCGEAATATALPVPCPTKLPAPGIPHVEFVSPKTCTLAHGDLCRRVWISQKLFANDYQGVGREPYGHLEIDVAPMRRERLAADTFGCLFRQAGGSAITVRGRRGVVFECPQGGTHGGHTLIRWIENGVAFGVSLHGHSEANEKLALRIAEAAMMVRPQQRQ